MARGISLHLGLNLVDPAHYSGWDGALEACEFDAVEMRALADRLGYQSTILLTKNATCEAVATHIRQAAETTNPGDIFLLTYAGHGGQLPDRNSDEPDGADETWCLYDGQLIDDNLFGLFARFKAGVRIFVVSDSCHSGTVIRQLPKNLTQSYPELEPHNSLSASTAQIRVRAMPPKHVRATYLQNKARYDAESAAADPRAMENVVATVRLFSACKDDQVALDGTFHGFFTGQLLRVWNDARFRGNYSEFHAAILASMPPEQQSNHFIIGSPLPNFDAESPFAI
jgi:metacaspase-1